MKLNEDIKFIILLVAVILSMAAAFVQPDHAAVFYDCRVAEISPDVPPKIKEECRKKMSAKPWLREQGKH